VPLAVVENFDVLLERRFGVSTGGIPLMMNHLVLPAPQKLSMGALS
jgi:hypothetical protein